MGLGELVDRGKTDVVACPIVSRLRVPKAGDDTHRLHAKNS
jgi:hypothetical protein